MEDLIEVTVRESVPDLATGQHKVVLQSRATGRVLSIWVGQCEGSAIGLGLESAWTPRPMTHDLMEQIIEILGATVERVVITDVRENTYLAVLCLIKDDQKLRIDSRPSDAIALAIRVGSPIFISSHLEDKMADELDDLFQQLEPGDTVH